jgi:ubiquinone/menaquinone biosynthesis C-methylase UbiE
MTASPPPAANPETSGRLIRTPWRYDFRLWLGTWGREGRFRAEELRLARLAAGERMLDVGCGTGSLAIAAVKVVGPGGRVVGVDPSPEMIGRAKSKARLKRARADFVVTAGEALPFPDASFDVVTTSLVLHQLPREALHAMLAQVKRVLVPGGRFLAVDIGARVPGQKTVHSHGQSHGSGTAPGRPFDLDHVAMLFEHLGFTIVERGPVAFQIRRLEPMQYLLAEVPTPA